MNRFSKHVVAASLLAGVAGASFMTQAQATGGNACTAAATSATAASDAIVASALAAPDEAVALISCVFPLMPEKDFRSAIISASEGVKNAQLGQFIIETASNLLFKSKQRKSAIDAWRVPDGGTAVPDRSASSS